MEFPGAHLRQYSARELVRIHFDHTGAKLLPRKCFELITRTADRERGARRGACASADRLEQLRDETELPDVERVADIDELAAFEQFHDCGRHAGLLAL